MERPDQTIHRKRRKVVKKLRVPNSPTIAGGGNTSPLMGNRGSGVLPDIKTDSDSALHRKLSKPKLSKYMRRVTTTTSNIWKTTTASTSQKTLPTTSRTNLRNREHHMSNVTTTTNSVTAPTTSKVIAAFQQHQQQQKPNAMQRYFDPIRHLRESIPEINEMFDLHQLIGYGAFSVVLLATLKRENKLSYEKRTKFAIKHLSPNNSPKRVKREMQFLTKIGGTDNIVKLNCCVRSEQAIAFVMPYLQCEHFKYYYRLMDPSEVQLYMQNLLVALRHVHKFQVIHRDVKPGNFLYNRVKRKFLLVDFGLAEEIPDANGQKVLDEVDKNEVRRASRAGTRGFRPPEVLLRYVNQTTAVDMWAVGVIFFSILCRTYPIFKPPSDQVAMKEILTVFGDKQVCKIAKKLRCSVPITESLKPLDLRKVCLHLRNLCKNPVLKNLQAHHGLGADSAVGRCRNCRQMFSNCLCLNTGHLANSGDDLLDSSNDPYPPSAYDLLYKLLSVNPFERITAEDALKHEFFRERLSKNSQTGGNFDMPIRGGLLQALSIKQNQQINQIQ